MVSEGKGNLFRRKDGKYLIYIPLDLAEDSMFPFKDYRKTKRGADSIPLKVSFKIGDKKLLIERWDGPDKQAAEE
ncbi:hypothetical protein KEJ15_01030 [Candidatus Bathyarchaeota archaeon]|jgi:hypothetical protein|nr:hypothetical protein [Candidatus Bathyarchaeota archaeon]MDH7564054.1 hypothetical protein [Candidatus Bathyarchaeota archaeon]